MPHIVVAGGTGFLGRALGATLAGEGYEVVVLSRRGPSAQSATAASSPPGSPKLVNWTPDGDVGPWSTAIEGAAAVVNLAGESIAGRRWTHAHKARILESRLAATRSLTRAIAGAANPPPVFVSQSAIGYYGPRSDEIVTEESPPGSDFLADVCARWEAEAAHSASHRTRVVTLRTGLVLARDAGALPPMLPPFWFGAGGPVGSGRQYWSWIHLADWTALAVWAIGDPRISGAVNATAPAPVTNRDFARALGRALHRPALMPAPSFAVRLILGEMAVPLVLTGQRVVPAKAERFGFRFQYTAVDDALTAVFRR